MLALSMLYSLSLIVLGLCADARWRIGGAVAVLMVAGLIGLATWLFVAMALGYVALSAWMQARPGPPLLAWARLAVWVVASAGLVLHAWPGHEGLVVVEQQVLKADSLPVSLYLNHDKVLVAWSLLGWLPLFGRSVSTVGGMSSLAVPWLAVAGIVALMGLAVALGLVAWQPGLPEVVWVFAVANLLNTCIAEELLFRGMLQRWLMGRAGALAAVALTSALFGVAHLTGGGAFVLVATAAGLLYGLVYLWTGRLVWAVLVHWGLNLSHLLLFSYPMLAGA
ncbi:hypothetical protein DFP85_107108 [Halomonas ventosae]|uniref:CAAX prenyl protease 2/Lysostaphin resistance protein A-like domain-containing protein n=1 Tax=Halomonas ventosae TaxID=229007 RepID=A0A4R6ZPI3_9GAMM|nr:CPBP family intramembrane glutamic endopeptidase [Halomonas ventosae]TDR54335.1 hypothetical protein DFP85_107108 [Halomonas ventosae]